MVCTRLILKEKMTERKKIVSIDIDPNTGANIFTYEDGTSALQSQTPTSTLAPSAQLQDYMREQTIKELKPAIDAIQQTRTLEEILKEIEPPQEDRRKEEPRRETDPNGKDPNSPGAKLDAGKNRGWLFFKGYARALKAISEVTTIGATKYTPNGWRTVVNADERYMDAFMRHLFEVALDKKYDDGNGGIGTLHMAQVIWNLLSVLELQLENEENANN